MVIQLRKLNCFKMCGLSGYFGNKKFSEKTVAKTLALMKNRGPDYQAYKEYKEPKMH